MGRIKKAFTLIELVFVIVVLGILATIALPKLGGAMDEAQISNAKSTVTAIRSGLQVYKNRHILLGQDPYPSALENDSSKLFSNVLPHPVTPSTNPGGWSKEGNYYIFHANQGKIAFSYNKDTGKFSCIEGSPTTVEGACKNF
ncbi:general secretion pathway protein G [Nitratiruptor sp. YY08-26]|uniref:type II secretion system protein n=1 Tax=unclassified Nitratiruptor TaxID=2624044 RepID=UPI0019364401|nr:MULTISPECIES: type II secretion system protein [unclassified Nitratiruptor]BCD62844.1 general secretion pathway protein G [Nitratiruptor sp. YY08-13]BCD66780.1 general secretion pathway protein G [Nitratiruptor sp. YY08-26]